MRSSLVLAALAAALAIGAPHAAAQTAAAQSASASYTAAAPLPAALAPSASISRMRETRIAPQRSRWRNPLMGALIGAAAGAALGAYAMHSADEWMAPPAYLLTAPAGAVAGFAIGGATNLIGRR